MSHLCTLIIRSGLHWILVFKVLFFQLSFFSFKLTASIDQSIAIVKIEMVQNILSFTGSQVINLHILFIVFEETKVLVVIFTGVNVFATLSVRIFLSLLNFRCFLVRNNSYHIDISGENTNNKF